ncbi:MAG TPA: S9 family peptidase [Acidimicrobiales bacterium]|nr:S9 family peptidase [Acidimicrobiales bacterium]
MPTTPELIPRDVLFGNPERILPRISPDGRKLAWVAPVDGVLNVWVGDVGSEDAKPVTDDRDRGIRQYFWAHDGRHLLYLKDEGGDENWRLHAVDLLSGSIRDLTPFEGVQAQVVEVSQHHPDVVLVGLNKDNPQLHDVYRVDLASGSLEKVADNPGFIGWVADHDLAVRAGIAPTPDGGMAVMVRDTPEGEWRPLLVVGQEDALSTSPVAFSRDGRSLLCVSSKEANAGRLVVMPLDPAGEPEVVAGDPRFDVSEVLIHPDTHQVQLVGFQRERLEWEAVDQSLAGDLAAMRALHPGDMRVANRDDADQVWLLGFTADDGPVSYFSFDRRTGEGTFLFHHQPELARFQLAAMEPFTYTATDGLQVSGYLSFPPGADRRSLPTVLDVHGGPWARDMWGFHPEAQWFANRGYLCIQVNYRGSIGYGKDFTCAGDREWAGAMHQDLVDAVAWAVGQGYTDPERVAIFGGSYGGYAALVGATFTPDLFRCAVDIVGPSSLKTLIESIPPYWAPLVAQFHTRVGNPDTEADFLWSRSPLSRVDAVRIPLLIAQGANDPRVKQAESEQFVAALREKGIDHEYMLFEDEGHGFAKPENRLRFYAAAERFLAKHLGGRSQD